MGFGVWSLECARWMSMNEKGTVYARDLEQGRADDGV